MLRDPVPRVLPILMVPTASVGPAAVNPAKEPDWVVTAGTRSATIDVVDKRASSALALAGRYAVGTTTLSLVDASRPAVPNGTYPGAPDHRLPSLVWYPADARRRGRALPVRRAGADEPRADARLRPVT